MPTNTCQKCYLKATLSVQPTLKAQLSAHPTLTGVLSKDMSANYYNGPYAVKPSFEDQFLATNNKLMTSDVEVEAIEVSRTTNLAGGITVYIGGIINA